MKKFLFIFIILFIQNCSSDTDPIDLPETVKLRETVVIEVTKIVEKEKIIYIDFSKNPNPWTPTPTPKALPTWTPTPTPKALPTWTPTTTPKVNILWTLTPTPTKAPIWTPTPTPTTAPTWTTTPTPTSTPVAWEFYLDGKLVTPTPSPPSTWTPTPTPKALPTWTPTPTPTPLPPGDLGYEKTSVTSSANLTDVGQMITIGIPENKSPIVDNDQDNDLTNGITTNDDDQFKILSVNHVKNGNTQVTIISLVPTGNSVIILEFWTTRK